MSVPLDKNWHDQLPPSLATVLPDGYSYIFHTFNHTDNSTSSNPAFTATWYINNSSESAPCQWIKKLQEYTATTYWITQGNREGCWILYKIERHCHHKPKKPTSKPICKNAGKVPQNHSLHRDKKTECVTHFSLKVRLISAWMCIIQGCLVICHVIPTRVKWPGITIIPSHLPMLLVSDKLTKKLNVNSTHTLSKATRLLQFTTMVSTWLLTVRTKIRSFKLLMRIPKDIYYLYQKWRVEKHGKENGEGMFKQLELLIDDYN